MHPLYLCDHTAPTAIFTLSLHDALPISGLPDGFRVDSDGNLWSSSLTGIQVFTPAGEKLGEIRVPEKVANCCLDRKSTRLNSSHVAISYAVFCLKKKKNELQHKKQILDV